MPSVEPDFHVLSLLPTFEIRKGVTWIENRDEFEIQAETVVIKVTLFHLCTQVQYCTKVTFERRYPIEDVYVFRTPSPTNSSVQCIIIRARIIIVPIRILSIIDPYGLMYVDFVYRAYSLVCTYVMYVKHNKLVIDQRSYTYSIFYTHFSDNTFIFNKMSPE